MTWAALMVAAAVAAGPVSLKFEGPLKVALQEIADKGGLNVVASGDLTEVVQVNFHDATAEEALDTLAQVYGLEVKKQGKVWVIRGKAQKAEAAAPSAAAAPVAPVAPLAPMAPAPPALPAWSLKAPVPHPEEDPTGEDSLAAAREAAQEAREAAEEAAQEARDAARDSEEALRDRQQEFKERLSDTAEAEAEVAQARARLEEARARAQDVSGTGAVVVKADEVVESAVSYGGPLVIEERAVVEGDAVAFGGDVVLKDHARVEGDAVSFGGKVVRGDDTTVGGESVAMGGSTLGTVISKQVIRERADQVVKSRNRGDDEHHGWPVAGFLVEFAALFVLGFLLTLFAPQRMKALEASIRAEPLTNGVVGLVGLAAAVPLSVILAITLIGIPVVAVLWLAVALFVPVGLAATATVLGRALPTGKLRKTQALVLAVGLFALLLVSKIPVLGAIFMGVCIFLSLGAIIRTRFGQPRPGLVTPDPQVIDATPAS